MMVLSNEEFSDYLAHHGILGQKWGIRRYQNKDGSLTDAGRKRYSGVVGKVRMMRDYSRERKLSRNRKRNLAKARKAKEVAKKKAEELEKNKQEWLKSPTELRKHLTEFSEEEIATAIKRFDADKRLADLQQAKIDRGMKYIKMVGEAADSATKIVKLLGEFEATRSKSAVANQQEAIADTRRVDAIKAKRLDKAAVKEERAEAAAKEAERIAEREKRDSERREAEKTKEAADRARKDDERAKQTAERKAERAQKEAERAKEKEERRVMNAAKEANERYQPPRGNLSTEEQEGRVKAIGTLENLVNTSSIKPSTLSYSYTEAHNSITNDSPIVSVANTISNKYSDYAISYLDGDYTVKLDNRRRNV